MDKKIGLVVSDFDAKKLSESEKNAIRMGTKRGTMH
jgi:hypothetical protein